MKAEVVYFFAYDIAQEADLGSIESAIRDTVEPVSFGRLKDAPRDFPVYHPLAIQIRESETKVFGAAVRLLASVKIFAVGALSVKIRIPVQVESIRNLLCYRSLQFEDGSTPESRAAEIARQVFERIKGGLDTPVAALPVPEAYIAYCIETPLKPRGNSSEWLTANGRAVAALLVGETDPECLSDLEVEDTVRHHYAYYRHDLVVIDWDAALVLDEPQEFTDTLYVMELANVQLGQLRTYDEVLDRVLDKAYDDVERAARVNSLGARNRKLKELRAIRMDITKVADEISNISKFFGEWHMARVYMGCAQRFHLQEWEDSVLQKLRALADLYTMLQQDSGNRLMLILESAIVALFIVDLVLIVLLGKT